MSKQTILVEKNIYTCDACGAEIPDKYSMSITMHANNDIAYEWWVKGDYCQNCGEKLRIAIINAMPTPERYSKKFREDTTAIEIEKQLISKVELDTNDCN